MKRYSFILIILLTAFLHAQDGFLRVNLIGYKTTQFKTALFLSKNKIESTGFSIHDALTGKVVRRMTQIRKIAKYGNFTTAYELNFTGFRTGGAYYISMNGIKSPLFRIGDDIYNGSADFLLRYIRQQQCGYNPLLRDSCHRFDGFIIYNDSLEGKFIDVRGGWHDASDYLRYSATSATTVFQLLLAYKLFPASFGDRSDKNGDPGKNTIPDVLDAAGWGADWLNKMYPGGELMFNQVADDRDHRGWRLPTEDTTSYGNGLMRPVYFVSGEPQGLYGNLSRMNGRASTAAKFSSALALSTVVLNAGDKDDKNLLKAKEAYALGIQYPGSAQTAPCRSPYFYEEDNYADDMELASAMLFMLTGEKQYLENAKKFAALEPVTPWFGKDTANHYQWYPFVNLGHYVAAASASGADRKYFTDLIRKGLEVIETKKANSFFNLGIPFIWCSNNLISSLLIQYMLYRSLTGDMRFAESEARLAGWLFGLNPWGTSMVVGLPGQADTPEDIHSAFSHLHKMKIDGALVDGPVYASIYNNLKGIKLSSPDEYENVEPGGVVYHDDWGDYSTNEPTLDGTASLLFYLSSLETPSKGNQVTNSGAVTRMDSKSKQIKLIFSGHEFAEGGEHILNVLKKENVKASYFFTGDFYRNAAFAPIIQRLKREGHYLGAHSDKHLLYCSWENRDSTLVGFDEFFNDLNANYLEMEKFGIKKEEAGYYLPPFEWWNDTIAYWTSLAGLELINFTPGTATYRDWTIPVEGSPYYSSDKILEDFYAHEAKNGLNGNIMLMHIGTDPRRTDKFYLKLEEMIRTLKKKGYTFSRF